jgi:hypothetical protein
VAAMRSDGFFDVTLDGNGHQVLARVAGKMDKNKIKVVRGDKADRDLVGNRRAHQSSLLFSAGQFCSQERPAQRESEGLTEGFLRILANPLALGLMWGRCAPLS